MSIEDWGPAAIFRGALGHGIAITPNGLQSDLPALKPLD
jgi:hypothetical protein